MSKKEAAKDVKKEEPKKEVAKDDKKKDDKGKTYKVTQVKIKNIPEKKPTTDDFELVKDVEIGPLKEGELLVKSVYISVDPYQRFQLKNYVDNSNGIPQSHIVASVVESKNDKFKAGQYIYGVFGASSMNVLSAAACKKISICPPDITGVKTIHDSNDDDSKKDDEVDLNKIDKRYFMGVLGMPAQTAYFGLINKAKIKKNETIVISGAAGAVGNVVGQIAKQIYNCTVIGLAGTKEKCDWLVKDLGFDAALNYKDYKTKKDMQSAIKKAINDDKKKVNIYFDNTGGLITESLWDLLGFRARVIICGQIAHYNEGKNPKLTYNHLGQLIYREIEVKGLMVAYYLAEFLKFYKDMGKWVLQGKMKVKDTVLNGIDKTPDAFCGLFTGKNIGKMVVKC